MQLCKACRLAPGKGISASHLYSLLLRCVCGVAALIHTIVHVIHHCSAAAAAASATAAAAEKVSVRLFSCRNAPQAAPRRYSADDAEQMSDDDDGYDEYTGDVAANSNAPRSSYNRSISKTPGRPPPHRNQRRARHGHVKKH